MQPSSKSSIYSEIEKVSRDTPKLKGQPASSLTAQTKAEYRHQKQQKSYKFIETEQLSTEGKMAQVGN